MIDVWLNPLITTKTLSRDFGNRKQPINIGNFQRFSNLRAANESSAAMHSALANQILNMAIGYQHRGHMQHWKARQHKTSVDSCSGKNDLFDSSMAV